MQPRGGLVAALLAACAHTCAYTHNDTGHTPAHNGTGNGTTAIAAPNGTTAAADPPNDNGTHNGTHSSEPHSLRWIFRTRWLYRWYSALELRGWRQFLTDAAQGVCVGSGVVGVCLAVVALGGAGVVLALWCAAAMWCVRVARRRRLAAEAALRDYKARCAAERGGADLFAAYAHATMPPK
eukprot:gene13806-19734_t